MWGAVFPHSLLKQHPPFLRAGEGCSGWLLPCASVIASRICFSKRNGRAVIAGDSLSRAASPPCNTSPRRMSLPEAAEMCLSWHVRVMLGKGRRKEEIARELSPWGIVTAGRAILPLVPIGTSHERAGCSCPALFLFPCYVSLPLYGPAKTNRCIIPKFLGQWGMTE